MMEVRDLRAAASSSSSSPEYSKDWMESVSWLEYIKTDRAYSLDCTDFSLVL